FSVSSCSFSSGFWIADFEFGLVSTRPTRRYSVRPRSELTRMGKRARTIWEGSAGRPANRRMTGATNSGNVKIADVGKPGRMTTGTGRAAFTPEGAAHPVSD